MTLPDYTVRESQRAKHPSIQVSVDKGLVVVVPKGFNKQEIPKILEKQRKWIEKTLHQNEQKREFLQAKDPEPLPEKITLTAIAQQWQVEYIPEPTKHITWTVRSPKRLIIRGDIANIELCKRALQRWLALVAHRHLEPWLRKVSQQTGLTYGNSSVRGQKTLWASCSKERNISLNYKLLFLPESLVHYVFVHELCHTIHFNHSAKFWALVQTKDTNYKSCDRELREAWRYVPIWV